MFTCWVQLYVTNWYILHFELIKVLAGILNHVTIGHREVTPGLSCGFTNHNLPVILVNCDVLGTAYVRVWSLSLQLTPFAHVSAWPWILHSVCIPSLCCASWPIDVVWLSFAWSLHSSVWVCNGQYLHLPSCWLLYWQMPPQSYIQTCICIAPFSLGTILSKFITLPFPFSMWISNLTLHTIFQPCLCNSLDILSRLKLCSFLYLHSFSTARSHHPWS